MRVAASLLDEIESADRQLDSPELLPEQLVSLERIFAQHKQLAKLSELLWLHKETAFCDLFVVGVFLRVSGKAGVYARFAPGLRSWLASHPPRFSQVANLVYFRDLTAEQKADFVRAKYMNWPSGSSTEFLTAVDEFARFAQLSRPLAEFLYQRRRRTNVSFDDWLADVRVAEVVKHISLDTSQLKPNSHPDFGQVPKLPPLWQLMDPGATKSFFDRLDSSTGLLLCTFHGGYLGFAQSCFTLLMDDHYMVRANAVRPNDIRARDDLAGFRMFKALAAQKVVFMAPDGGALRQASTIEILGKPVKLANGASTIAFEANCRTGWYTVLRDGDRFVPAYAEGPQRQPGQTFAAFNTAWWQFYAAQIENVFTGDPCNITVYNRWPWIFRSAR